MLLLLSRMRAARLLSDRLLSEQILCCLDRLPPRRQPGHRCVTARMPRQCIRALAAGNDAQQEDRSHEGDQDRSPSITLNKSGKICRAIFPRGPEGLCQ